MKNELNTCFQQKFATGSYGVGIGRAWCSRKACEICSSLVQKKKLKKIYFSSHKLPKQQSTSFWFQGILGVNDNFYTPKLIKIRCPSLFFGSFAHQFEMKLSIHGSNLNSICVIVSELKFFLLTRVLTQNFNTVDLVKFLEKNKKLHI
jgi:hypothetical protein